MITYGASPLEIMACNAMLQGLVYMDEFSYPTAWIQGTTSFLPSMGDITTIIVINSDSDFICQQYNLTAFATGLHIEHPNLLLTITRSGSGRNLMSAAVHVGNNTGSYFSNNSLPGSMPITSLYQGNTQVTFRLQNLSTTSFDRVDLSLRGFKVFYQTNQNGQTGNRQDIFHAL